MARKVLLGFSGGMDSCRAAEILREQGYDVTALYLDMYGDEEPARKAREKAESLGVPFRTLDLGERFRQTVIRYFTSEYMLGRTPAPCTVCNRDIKWQVLSEVAAAENFDHVATGHYFNIAEHNGRLYIAKAADPLKDQSYYLWALGQDVLSLALAPMGDQIKSELAARGALTDRGEPYKESMGVCFLKGRSVAGFLEVECGAAIHEGDIVDKNGVVIGRHRGTPYYTIGQKRGLDLPTGMCVGAVDASANRLVAGGDADLYYHNLILSGCNIVDRQEVLSAKDITVKIRGIGRNPAKPCLVRTHEAGLHVILDDPAWAPAAGQPVVLYRGDRVIGGGFLEKYY